MSLEIENGNYLKLLHAMIRQDGKLNEPDRSRAVMMWASDKTTAIGKVLTLDQRRLMSLALEEFRTNKMAPSLTILQQRVESSDKGEVMEAILKEYDGGDGLPEYTAYDTDALLADVTSEWKKTQFAAMLVHAMTITKGAVQGDVRKKEKDMAGPDDARMYLMRELQSDLFARDMMNVGGSIGETADQLITNYEANKRAALTNSLVIPTGITHIDRTIHGLRRGTLNLILGTAGQRKSAVARTVAYNAVMAGFRVLFIPLEINFADELTAFGIIHAHNPIHFKNILPISIESYQRGMLRPEEEAALRDAVIPDLKDNIGDRLVIRQLADTTWENIRSVIELENFISPLDLVVIDYIGLLDTRHHKDKTFAINEAAIQMKQMALSFPNGKGGLTIMSPAQGSRKGFEEASTNDGVWEKTGIYMYSELEKSADIIFYTFLPQEMQDKGEIKIGTCKSRSSADAAGVYVPIDLSTGYIGGGKKVADTNQSDRSGSDRAPELTGSVWDDE